MTWPRKSRQTRWWKCDTMLTSITCYTCHSVHRGVYTLPQVDIPPGRSPLGHTPPLGRPPPDIYLSTPRQTPSWAPPLKKKTATEVGGSHPTGMHSCFLAKLFPQLCLCHWNGNYDLFSNFVTFLALLWPFCDLFMTYLAILWPFCDLYDLFMTF